MRKLTLVSLFSLLVFAGMEARADTALITATASSEHPSYPAENAVDGIVSDASRWLNVETDNPAWLRLDFAAERLIRGIILNSGWKDQDAIRGFVVERLEDSAWVEIPSSRVSGNTSLFLVLSFDEDVHTTALRLVFSDTGYVRVREVDVWETRPIVPIREGDQTIYLNQSGFRSKAPKRFSMPNGVDGTPFAVENAATGEVLYRGTIQDEIGDFSAVTQTGDDEFIVIADGRSSDPFRIGPWWLERVTSQLSIDFMIESRHYLGNVTKMAVGSFGWRDDHHFAFSLTTLVDQYMSNPALYERMPSKVSYVTPRAGIGGALNPWNESAPDIVKLIHWGADVVVTQGLTHEFMKGELASFLYAWPLLQEWLPQQNYDAVKAFALAHWSDTTADRSYPYDTSTNHDLFALKTIIGSTKGENPPGHSILPNVLMWQALIREEHPDANLFRDAARAQVAWIVDNLDWTDPQTTKGQRMSENLTLMGLSIFARLDPAGRPAGLNAFIEQWADVAISRSDNLWDFRTLTDSGDWVPNDPDVATAWNEPGNVAGLPAALYEVDSFLTDPSEKDRLLVLAQSHFDNMFGRNPTGRHFSYDAPSEIEGVERGWFSFHPGGIGQLRDVTFVLDGSPKNEHYPYNPEAGNVGWTEGWIQFNTAYNRSLAARAFHLTELQLMQRADRIELSLRAPLNFNYSVDEPVDLLLTSSGGDSETVSLVEASAFSETHIGSVPVEIGGSPVAGNGILETSAGEEVFAGYGFGHRRKEAQLLIVESVIGSYADWQAKVEWNGMDSSPLAHVGTSGLTNLEAFAFGLDSPFEPAPQLQAQVFELSADQLSAYLSYRHNRRAEDVDITVLASNNLIHWETVTMAPGDLLRSDLGGDVDAITARIPTGEADRFFIRLNITQNASE